MLINHAKAPLKSTYAVTAFFAPVFQNFDQLFQNGKTFFQNFYLLKSLQRVGTLTE